MRKKEKSLEKLEPVSKENKRVEEVIEEIKKKIRNTMEICEKQKEDEK